MKICSHCDFDKPEEEFKLNRGRRDKICKKCHSKRVVERQRVRYETDVDFRNRHIAYVKEYKARKREEKKEIV